MEVDSQVKKCQLIYDAPFEGQKERTKREKSLIANELSMMILQSPNDNPCHFNLHMCLTQSAATPSHICMPKASETLAMK